MIYSLNSICSYNGKIWGVCSDGLIYEINIQNKTIELVQRIEEIDYSYDFRFPIMNYIDGNILIAPNIGQKFRQFNPSTGRSVCLSDVCTDAFSDYYESDDEVIFIGRNCKNIAIYHKNECTIEIKKFDGDNSYVAQSETRGGCVLSREENEICSFVYGAEQIDILSRADNLKKVRTLKFNKPIAFAHIINNDLVVVTVEGKFWIENNGALQEIPMPLKANKCKYPPFHYWTRINGGIVFMPCGMNMILFYKDREVEEICSSSLEMNKYWQIGIYPCCKYGDQKIIGFQRYEECLYEIDVEHKKINKIVLSVIMNQEIVTQFVGKQSKQGRVILENYNGISLKDFLNAIVADR